MADVQHDHHCLVTVAGSNWRIAETRGLLLFLTCQNGCCKAVIDLSNVDLDAWCAEAVLFDAANAARAARGAIPAAPFSSARH